MIFNLGKVGTIRDYFVLKNYAPFLKAVKTAI